MDSAAAPMDAGIGGQEFNSGREGTQGVVCMDAGAMQCELRRPETILMYVGGHDASRAHASAVPATPYVHFPNPLSSAIAVTNWLDHALGTFLPIE